MSVDVKPSAASETVPGLDEVLSVATIAELAIAPDGAEVAYVVHTQDSPSECGSSVIRIVSTADGTERALAEGMAPAWSPDRKRVAFV